MREAAWTPLTVKQSLFSVQVSLLGFTIVVVSSSSSFLCHYSSSQLCFNLVFMRCFVFVMSCFCGHCLQWQIFCVMFFVYILLRSVLVYNAYVCCVAYIKHSMYVVPPHLMYLYSFRNVTEIKWEGPEKSVIFP